MRLDQFPVVMTLPVAWGEMDALGHVNNAVYFRYFETARIEYFNRIQIFDLFDIQKIGPVLRDTACHYKRPVAFPDTLTLCAKVDSLEEFGFSMSYQILNAKQKLTTTGKASVVLFDFAAKKKSALPDVLVERIKALEVSALQ